MSRWSKPASIAEVISELFNDDGLSFEVEGPDGTSYDLDEICRLHAQGDADEDAANKRRHSFSDGSAITIQTDVIRGNFWDLGFRDCFCMAEDGHSQGCRDRGGCD